MNKKNQTVGLMSLYTVENNGLRVLSSILRENGYRVIEIYLKDWKNNCLELPNEYEINSVIKILKQYDADLLGVSVRTSGFMNIASNITNQIKEELNLPVIWGGMHPTSMPEECIKVVDFICIGEAEEAFIEFVNKFFQNERLDNILNIWRNKDKIISRNPLRPVVADLNSIPFRDFMSQDKYFIDKKSVAKGDPCLNDRIYLINASRGCLYQCSFCMISLLKDIYKNYGSYLYRCRSVDNIIQELLEAKKFFPKLKRIRFDDELFIADKNWLRNFSKEYKKHIALPFDILTHPSVINKESLLLLKKAGLDTVLVGVQNTERINKVLYSRHQNNDQVIAAANVLRSLGLKSCYQVILDDPVSTSNDKNELFKLICSLPRPYELYLFSLTIYPNTPLAKKLISDGYIKYSEQLEVIKKIFYQYRVDLNFKRSKEDIFWTSLLVLASKRFIPIEFLKAVSKSQYLKKNPYIIKCFAQFVNLLKMIFIVSSGLLKGEINLKIIKRWLNFKSLITQ
ncbi:MAG: radical SAM protein [Candidatus Saelkia tenebricola]|nr:radical SAM protein [Candidatus Saelkia tenebricola]